MNFTAGIKFQKKKTSRKPRKFYRSFCLYQDLNSAQQSFFMSFQILSWLEYEIHSLYRSPNIDRVIKYKRLGWAIHVARMEECRNTFKIVTSKPTGKRPSAKPRRRWEDNIRNDLK